MPRLYSARKIVKAFKKAGFVPVSQQGSHLKMRGVWNDKIRTFIVPMHKEVALGTFKSILSQADMTSEDFKKFV